MWDFIASTFAATINNPVFTLFIGLFLGHRLRIGEARWSRNRSRDDELADLVRGWETQIEKLSQAQKSVAWLNPAYMRSLSEPGGARDSLRKLQDSIDAFNTCRSEVANTLKRAKDRARAKPTLRAILKAIETMAQLTPMRFDNSQSSMRGAITAAGKTISRLRQHAKEIATTAGLEPDDQP